MVVIWTCAPIDGHRWECPHALADDADADAAAAAGAETDVDSARGALKRLALGCDYHTSYK